MDIYKAPNDKIKDEERKMLRAGLLILTVSGVSVAVAVVRILFNFG
jgi:hypothetical protein